MLVRRAERAHVTQSTRPTSSDAIPRLDAAVASLLHERRPWVLAVSGGIDSMSLLDACARAPRAASLTVATFDHGTGDAATRAVKLVHQVATSQGVELVVGRSATPKSDEASWRDDRWRFLRDVAHSRGAAVVTAHTRDDQVETIVMRVLRGAGGRGLSALRAPSPVRRPFLDLARTDVEAYASLRGLAWIDDPSNQRRAHLRNRVRHDLLPVLRSQDSGLEGELLRLAEESGTLRATCADAVAQVVIEAGAGRVLAHAVIDESWGDDAAALFCQTLGDFAGVALDRRGTTRLARFARTGRVGRMIPLSGGWEAVRRRDTLEIRRGSAPAPERATLSFDSTTVFGSWRFRTLEREPASAIAASTLADSAPDAWSSWLPSDATLEVRCWTDGDRMIATGSGLRRVKRFLSDSGVVAADRSGWPVVLADGEIVWIPGVRRARAATARPGRPRVCVVCERLYR